MELTQGSRNYALIKSIDTTNEYAHVNWFNSYLQMCVIFIEIENNEIDEQKSWR